MKTLRMTYDKKGGFMAFITEVIDKRNAPWGRAFRGDYKPTEDEAIDSVKEVYEKHKDADFLPVRAQ